MLSSQNPLIRSPDSGHVLKPGMACNEYCYHVTFEGYPGWGGAGKQLDQQTLSAALSASAIEANHVFS